MTYYGAKDLAAAFRTVRKNTLTIAEEIPENQYDYRPAKGTRSVGELLAHIALGGKLQEQINLVEKRSTMVGFDFMTFREQWIAETNQPRTKAQIIALLQEEGEKYASAVEGLTDDFLGEMVTTPPGAQPGGGRTRFDLFLAVKEHEMHHRGQLMLIERLIGITPHLTREGEARMAAMRAAAEQKA